jgi:hypothetical protein
MPRVDERLKRLEAALLPAPRLFIVFMETGETKDTALARHLAACPGDRGGQAMFVRWVSPGDPDTPSGHHSVSTGR